MKIASALVVAAAAAAAVAGAWWFAWRAPHAAAVSGEVADAVARSRAKNPEAWRRRVVVLGFDSCDPDLVDRMIREGKLPNFARLRREGASGFLETTQPPLSPVVWTTIATGMPPERHGILDFLKETPKGGTPGPVTSAERQADTVWDLLSRNGETVGVVGWLVTYPAEPVNGFLVTDRMGLLAFDYGRKLEPDLPRRTYPEDLAKEVESVRVTIDDLPLWKIRPFADVTEAEYRDAYSDHFDPRNRLGNLRLTLATAETFRAAGEKLYDEHRPRFFALYFEAMDALSHLFMRYAPPKLPDVDEKDYLKYRTAIEQDYVWHDGVLGEFLDRADADTTVFVVSDHGFRSGEFRRGDPSDFNAKTGAMWHRNYGVFFAWGLGVARGRQVDGATVLDVAPTVLAAMGYPKPKDMPGRVLEEAFQGGLPHEEVSTYYGDSRRERMAADTGAAAAADESPEAQAEMEKLRALGYIGGGRDDPSNSHMNLGQRFLQAGRIEDARAEFEKALEQARHPGTLGALAEALLLLAKRDEARKLVDEALAKDPSDVSCRLLHARLLLVEGKGADAEKAARAVVADKPEVFYPHAVLALILEARAVLAEREGDAKETLRCRAAALAEHEMALRLEPNHVPSLLAAAELILQDPRDIQRLPVALEHLEHLLRLRPDHTPALNDRAAALLRVGIGAQLAGRPDVGREKLEEAVASARKAVDSWRKKTGREYAKGWANQAYGLWRLDRMDECAAAALKAREVDPSYVFGSQQFLAALAAAGHEMPPPAPKKPATPPQTAPQTPPQK